MTRKNLRDDYEGIILRSDMFARHMNDIPNGLLIDKDFNRIIKYMASRFYKKHAFFLENHTYSYEDILNLCRVWGATCIARGIEANDDKGRKYLLMRYLGQRLFQFLNWTNRKFQTDEVISEKVSIDSSRDSKSEFKNDILDSIPDYRYSPDHEVEVSKEEYVMQIRDNLSLLSQELIKIRSQIRKLPKTDKTYDTIQRQYKSGALRVRKLKKELKDIKVDKKDTSKENSRSLSEFKEQIMSNPVKFKSQLCYFATIKLVDKDVRIVAREMCDKNNFDYIAWAKSYIKKNNYDENMFDLYRAV